MAILLSANSQGYVIVSKGKTVASRYYKTQEGTVRDRVLKNLESGLLRAKGIVDHDKMVIELDNSYVHRHVADDQRVPRSDASSIYKLGELLDECDAAVTFKLVSRTKAESFAKFSKSEIGDESVTSMFAEFEDGDEL